MEDMVRRLGETILISVSGRGWIVPRHYVALHGIKASELPVLARRYGFPEVEGYVEDSSKTV